MCQFFSVVSDGKGNIMYFDWKLREKCLKKELPYEPDSHTSIADYFGYKGEKEDVLNKYEYHPLTKKFQVDQLNTEDDSKVVERFCNKLDFKEIVPQLIVKPIIHPFELKPKKVTKKDIHLLKEWNSVWYSVGNSVWYSVGNSVRDTVRDLVGDSVGNSVWYSVGNSVWNSVWYSVGNSVRDSIGASVWDLVGASVRDSVGDSVGNSVGAYTSSFFNLPKWKYIDHKEGVNPFQCCIDLWERGFVPSFDGKIWHIHSGQKAKVVFKIAKEKLCSEIK